MDTFTEEDLAPGPAEKAAVRRVLIERIGATISIIAAGLHFGGTVALGACAAPAVFHYAQPFAGRAMGNAFASFGRVAIGATVAILAGEVLRTWAARHRGVQIIARVRRYLAIFLAAATAYVALIITPQIMQLHLGGAVRREGPEGMLLDMLHDRAELFGKAEVVFALALIVMHVLTLPTRVLEDDDFPLVAPLPPGPKS
jgi:hypothetical protein